MERVTSRLAYVIPLRDRVLSLQDATRVYILNLLNIHRFAINRGAIAECNREISVTPPSDPKAS